MKKYILLSLLSITMTSWSQSKKAMDYFVKGEQKSEAGNSA